MTGILNILLGGAGAPGADFSISPSVSGKAEWTFANDGNLDLSSAGIWTITMNKTVSTRVKMWGGGGGGAWGNNGQGGGAGAATGDISLATGSTYKLVVGGRGRQGQALPNPMPGGVPGGGGNASYATDGRGNSVASGGGYSGLFITSENQPNARLMAGGGGGGAGGGGANGAPGGGGGGTNGQAAPAVNVPADGCGQGGTQNAGGAGASVSPNQGQPGSALQGGNGHPTGGGAGGGYYGGGSGGNNANSYGGGGGGGSGYYHSPNVSNVTLYTGGQVTPGNNNDPDRGNSGNGGPTSGGYTGNDTQYWGVDGRIVISKL